MRVTENTNFETVKESIRKSRERMDGLQQQSATMKKINTPSDNPVGVSKLLEIRTDKVNNDQFQMNSKLAQTFLANTEHALSEISEILMRAKEIALGQSSDANTSEDTRLGVAEEVQQLFQQAVATANRRIGDRYLFGGFKTQKAPIDAEGRYQGDSGQMMVEIAKDVFVASNVSGIEAFNTHPKNSFDSRKNSYEGQDTKTRAPASAIEEAGGQAPDQSQNVNVFDEIQNLRIALLTGDTEGVRSTLERLDQIQSRVITMRTRLGSRLHGIETTGNTLERHNIANATLSSAIEDADMAQVVSDTSREEAVLKNALTSSHKLIQPTLIDFLK
ncbi:flagellar hook-associated protein FlgL [Bdellovibrionota bacterium FG-2]